MVEKVLAEILALLFRDVLQRSVTYSLPLAPRGFRQNSVRS